MREINLTTRISAKLKIMSNFADTIKGLSCCKRAEVGCIIFTPDFTSVCSIGYNGPARGESNDCCTNEPGKCGCIHAEANALLKLDSPKMNLILYSTTAPCVNCAGLILNTRQIIQVRYKLVYRSNEGVQRLERAGITVIHDE